MSQNSDSIYRLHFSLSGKKCLLHQKLFPRISIWKFEKSTFKICLQPHTLLSHSSCICTDALQLREVMLEIYKWAMQDVASYFNTRCLVGFFRLAQPSLKGSDCCLDTMAAFAAKIQPPKDFAGVLAKRGKARKGTGRSKPARRKQITVRMEISQAEIDYTTSLEIPASFSLEDAQTPQLLDITHRILLEQVKLLPLTLSNFFPDKLHFNLCAWLPLPCFLSSPS